MTSHWSNGLKPVPKGRHEWHEIRIRPALTDLGVVELKADSQGDAGGDEDEGRKRSLTIDPVARLGHETGCPERG